tara:strand:+ start:661 stop:819 length:159 start_codon:yes stop_codon:yes gene_type:complete
MYLERLLKKLQQATCGTKKEKQNVDINIKLTQMQINIRDKRDKIVKRNGNKR